MKEMQNMKQFLELTLTSNVKVLDTIYSNLCIEKLICEDTFETKRSIVKRLENRFKHKLRKL